MRSYIAVFLRLINLILTIPNIFSSCACVQIYLQMFIIAPYDPKTQLQAISFVDVAMLCSVNAPYCGFVVSAFLKFKRLQRTRIMVHSRLLQSRINSPM